jgi:hypothetical protein
VTPAAVARVLGAAGSGRDGTRTRVTEFAARMRVVSETVLRGREAGKQAEAMELRCQSLLNLGYGPPMAGSEETEMDGE